MTDLETLSESGQRSAGHRQRAREFVSALRLDHPDLLSHEGIDLAPALEQQIFFALRDARSPRRPMLRAHVAVLGAGAIAASVLGLGRKPPADGPIVALVRSPAQMAIVDEVDAQLRQHSGRGIEPVRVGGATRFIEAPRRRASPRLSDLLDVHLIPGLLEFEWRAVRRLPAAVGAWPAEARSAAIAELPRIALGVTGLTSLMRSWQPSIAIALDEIGTWARLLPPVASRWGIPSLDLPHAEAADAIAIAGIRYDRVAVYGARATEVMLAAGLPADRIVEIGAPRFDPMVRAAHAATIGSARATTSGSIPVRRKVVYAAGYVTGAMTLDGLRRTASSAVAAASVLEPADLVVRPHPAARPEQIEHVLRQVPARPGVKVIVDRERTLAEVLPGADLLVTGWSNSVFEAAIAGVPAIIVVPEGIEAPIDLAGEGFGAAASDDATAAAAARILSTEATRDAAVAMARSALTQRIGALDGGAAARAAELIIEMKESRAKEAADRFAP